jgi:hypothetical protein
LSSERDADQNEHNATKKQKSLHPQKHLSIVKRKRKSENALIVNQIEKQAEQKKTTSLFDFSVWLSSSCVALFAG